MFLSIAGKAQPRAKETNLYLFSAGCTGGPTKIICFKSKGFKYYLSFWQDQRLTGHTVVTLESCPHFTLKMLHFCTVGVHMFYNIET